jgi:hypothetical protein
MRVFESMGICASRETARRVLDAAVEDYNSRSSLALSADGGVWGLVGDNLQVGVESGAAFFAVAQLLVSIRQPRLGRPPTRRELDAHVVGQFDRLFDTYDRTLLWCGTEESRRRNLERGFRTRAMLTGQFEQWAGELRRPKVFGGTFRRRTALPECYACAAHDVVHLELLPGRFASIRDHHACFSRSWPSAAT